MKLNRKIKASNYGVVNESLIYSIRNNDSTDLILLNPHRIIKLENIIGTISFIDAGGSFFINDLMGNRYFAVDKDEVIENVGLIQLLDTANTMIVKKTPHETIRLNFNNQLINSLKNYPRVQYQSLLHNGVMYFATNKVIGDKISSYGSQIMMLDLEKDTLENVLDAEPYSWKDDNGHEQNGWVRQIICVSEDSLIVHISMYHILAIDINTFEIRWQIEDFVRSPEYERYLAFGASAVSCTPMRWVLELEMNSLFLLARHYCWRIDLKQKKAFLERDFLDSNAEDRWNVKEASIYNKQLYFIGSKGYELFPNIAGVYDIKQKQIIEYQIIENGYFRDAPIIVQEKIILFDNNENLYIYDLNI